MVLDGVAGTQVDASLIGVGLGGTLTDLLGDGVALVAVAGVISCQVIPPSGVESNSPSKSRSHPRLLSAKLKTTIPPPAQISSALPAGISVFDILLPVARIRAGLPLGHPAASQSESATVMYQAARPSSSTLPNFQVRPPSFVVNSATLGDSSLGSENVVKRKPVSLLTNCGS